MKDSLPPLWQLSSKIAFADAPHGASSSPKYHHLEPANPL
jgi:hypothetical protein